MNTLFVATVQSFNKAGHTTDKNGNQNVIFSVLAGQCPSARVVSGTVAIRDGFTIGDTVLVSCTELEASPTYGRQFSFSKVSTMGALEIMDSIGKLGTGVIVDTKLPEAKPEEVEPEFKEA